jgi:thiosulfate/3-mercaptopyruvate sulfurtransferase
MRPWSRALVAWVLAIPFVAGLGVPGPARAAADPARLVDAAWLSRELARGDVLVLDASTAQGRRTGHIAGSVHADPFSTTARAATPAQVQQRYRAWGILADARQRIVVVDEGGTWGGARLFWDLHHHGVPLARLHLLDGGMAAWRAAGGAVRTEPAPASAAPAPGDVSLPAEPDERLRVRLPEFLAATADPARTAVVEALPPEYFFGAVGWFDRPGHVPHAKLWPAEDFFNADKTWKRGPALQAMAAGLGITPQQPVLAYCGGGGAAAVPVFALRFLAGHGDVRLFVESQRAWLQDPRELPVWHYADPHRLRDTAWLATWAGPMLRGFGLSKVTVVDVRPAAAYAQGHVPQSLNLPLATLRALAHEPAALAARLAQAGLDATHEAVVLSDRGGLDGDAATAALLLEAAGQARVSVYAGNVERWLDAGRTLARPQGAAAASPSGSATATWQGQAQPLLLRQPPGAAARDARPLAWLSPAGPAPQAAAPDGTAWRAVPAATLLADDGRPLPAAALWKRLEAAGVPRHARLVLDGRGDALPAAAQLRLLLATMGWRDVQVWMP